MKTNRRMNGFLSEWTSNTRMPATTHHELDETVKRSPQGSRRVEAESKDGIHQDAVIHSHGVGLEVGQRQEAAAELQALLDQVLWR